MMKKKINKYQFYGFFYPWFGQAFELLPYFETIEAFSDNQAFLLLTKKLIQCKELTLMREKELYHILKKTKTLHYRILKDD